MERSRKWPPGRAEGPFTFESIDFGARSDTLFEDHTCRVIGVVGHLHVCVASLAVSLCLATVAKKAPKSFQNAVLRSESILGNSEAT